MAEVIILGAGLTGLSTAYHLERHGFYDYTVFEKNSRPGGLLQSVQVDGFTFDYTGHLLHINNNEFKQFIDSITSLSNFHLIERKTGIFSHNIISDYPFQINLFGLPIDVAVECIEGYLKRSTHIQRPTNFHNWVLKHFGKGFGKHFFFPYNKKILAYNLKKIHPSWTGRFVPSTTLDMILRGTLEKKPPTGIGYNSSFYYPKHGGIEFLIKKLHPNLQQKIITNECVETIDPLQKTVTFSSGHTEQYRFLVSTIPLPHLLQKIQQRANSSLHNAAQKLACNAVVNINLGFSVDDIGAMHWLYFPEKNIPLYRLGFWHNISPHSVPPGRTAVYGEFSYMPGTLSEKKVSSKVAQSIQAITKFLKLDQHHIITQKTLTLPHAYVIYDRWREQNINKLLDHLLSMNIYSTGRYGAWKYSSMQEAFFDGKQTAATLLEQISVSLPNRKHFHNQPYL